MGTVMQAKPHARMGGEPMSGQTTASGWLRAEDEPGVLVRICATISARGYEIRTLSAQTSQTGELTVFFTVAAEASWLHRLPLFLQRIVPVHEVVMHRLPTTAEAAAAIG